MTTHFEEQSATYGSQDYSQASTDALAQTFAQEHTSTRLCKRIYSSYSRGVDARHAHGVVQPEARYRVLAPNERLRFCKHTQPPTLEE
eukprot:scaffold4111_cov19-Tisochrysis_lutea.AAC.3